MNRVDLRSAKNTLAGLAYQEILRAILAHEIRPGERLSPLDLAEHMGISPTPIKHSLARLAGEGIVEFRSGLGPFVVSPTDEDLAEYHDSRLMCEVFSVQQGIGHVDRPFLARLAEHLRRCEEALSDREDPAASQLAFARADAAFHLHLVSLWPNRKTETWYQQLNVHIRAALLRQMTGDEVPWRRLSEALADHRDIYEALERRDAAVCAEALHRHVRGTKEALPGRQRATVAPYQKQGV
ncbi:MAG: GntR family transcriptional regulator [Chloroflexota bacterium]